MDWVGDEDEQQHEDESSLECLNKGEKENFLIVERVLESSKRERKREREPETHVLKPPAQKARLGRFKKQLFVKSCVLSL